MKSPAEALSANAVRNRPRSTPARLPSSRASAVATAWPNRNRLTNSFVVYPAAGPPTWTMRCGSPRTSSNELHTTGNSQHPDRLGRSRRVARHVDPRGPGRQRPERPAGTRHRLDHLVRTGQHRDQDLSRRGGLGRRSRPPCPDRENLRLQLGPKIMSYNIVPSTNQVGTHRQTHPPRAQESDHMYRIDNGGPR